MQVCSLDAQSCHEHCEDNRQLAAMNNMRQPVETAECLR